MRKVDPRAKLKTLPVETQEALWDWLAEDTTRTLAEAAAWLFSEHDIRTDLRRISEWRAWFARDLQIKDFESEASEIEAALKRTGKYSAQQLEELGNVIFLNRATKLGDAKTFTAVAQVVQGRDRMKGEQQAHADKMGIAKQKIGLQTETLKQTKRRLDQADRKVIALEEQAAAAKAAAQRTKDALSSGGMDEAKRRELIAEMDHLILGKPKPQT